MKGCKPNCMPGRLARRLNLHHSDRRRRLILYSVSYSDYKYKHFLLLDIEETTNFYGCTLTVHAFYLYVPFDFSRKLVFIIFVTGFIF